MLSSQRAAVLAAALALALALLTALVATGAMRPVDEAVRAAGASIDRPELTLFSRLVTIAGQAEVTFLAAMGWSAWSYFRKVRAWHRPLWIFVAVGVEILLKLTVPQPLPAELRSGGPPLPFLHASLPYAYPSGHITRLAFLTGLLALLAPDRSRALAVFVAVAVNALNVATRIYLGEHWLSDVLGGILLGLAAAAVASASASARAAGRVRAAAT